jgi:D-alanyl-D-alanine carboxypeptidase/D-alanyl-D-alanine-endopeptidase (penicillin-binding protein 4)
LYCDSRKRPAIIICCVFAFACLSHRSYAGSLETIQAKIAQALKRPGIRSTDWGIEVADADNKVLVAVNPDKPFRPASVLKVLTTATALDKFGPDFRYRTTVQTNGTLQPDGVLVGDVILVGRGDPNLIDTTGELLEKPALQELAEQLHALGVRRITGDVIGDDSYFDLNAHGEGWTERDLKSIYGAPINALSYNNNVFWVHTSPTKVNRLVSVSIEPRTSYFRIRNLGVTGTAKAKRTMYARVIPGTKTLVISGVLPVGHGFSQHILLDRPGEVTATIFKEELQRHGISIGGGVQVVHSGEISPEARRKWKQLAEHQSPPLIRGVEIINKRSQNLHAEMLLRTLGAEFRDVGTDESGLEVVKDFIISAGIDTRGISLRDGCGLSRDNLVTPRFQTSLLLTLSSRPYFDLFLNTLAVSGTDGTLSRRLAAPPVRGVIHAKTGTLNGVSTLSGYMTTRSGRTLAFSIFANNAAASIHRVQRTIDEICSLFVNLY